MIVILSYFVESIWVGNFMNSFQERLEDFLIENNLSRLQLAKQINIHHETINGYFNDNLYPEIHIAKKIANYFNCSLDYLFGLSDEMHNEERNNLTFAETIRQLLKEKNKSIEKAMKELNMSESNYYRWKKGTKPLTSVIITLAKYFDVSVDYLASEFIR